MCFGAYELALNKDIQDKLRAEIRKTTPKIGRVTYDQLQQMQYMDMVISGEFFPCFRTQMSFSLILVLVFLPNYRNYAILRPEKLKIRKELEQGWIKRLKIELEKI